MDDFIGSEDGVEHFVATQNVARLRRELENEPDEFTRSKLLKLLLYEVEKCCLTRQQLSHWSRKINRKAAARPEL